MQKQQGIPWHPQNAQRMHCKRSPPNSWMTARLLIPSRPFSLISVRSSGIPAVAQEPEPEQPFSRPHLRTPNSSKLSNCFERSPCRQKRHLALLHIPLEPRNLYAFSRGELQSKRTLSPVNLPRPSISGTGAGCQNSAQDPYSRGCTQFMK